MTIVYTKTHGCQMNEYDTQKMVAVLEANGPITITENPEAADILLINTCSVREKAQEKLFSELGRFRKFKEAKPSMVIAVGGCVASQEGAEILKLAPFIDVIFGPQTLHRLPELIATRQRENRPVVDVSFPEIEKFDHLPEPKADGPTAYVSIMEGCSKYCSYCVVPYTRGTEINRPFDDVIAEIASLAEQGVREITLLGQNVNDYRGVRHDKSFSDLALLIHYVAAIDGIERIRFTTSHPAQFSSRLIEAYAIEPKLANHLHLPVQSGSDTILRAMKRNYTSAEFTDKIRKLREVRPDISITTDIIIGFPGETDNDFQATMDLVDTIGFDYSFSFLYSPRPGTPAAMLVDNIPLEIKKTRLQYLQDKLIQQGRQLSENMIGSTQRVLVSGRGKKNPSQLSGRTENNRVVNFIGPSHLVGQMVDVIIQEALPNSLRGELILSMQEAGAINL